MRHRLVAQVVDGLGRRAVGHPILYADGLRGGPAQLHGDRVPAGRGLPDRRGVPLLGDQPAAAFRKAGVGDRHARTCGRRPHDRRRVTAARGRRRPGGERPHGAGRGAGVVLGVDPPVVGGFGRQPLLRRGLAPRPDGHGGVGGVDRRIEVGVRGKVLRRPPVQVVAGGPGAGGPAQQRRVDRHAGRPVARMRIAHDVGFGFDADRRRRRVAAGGNDRLHVAGQVADFEVLRQVGDFRHAFVVGIDHAGRAAAAAQDVQPRTLGIADHDQEVLRLLHLLRRRSARHGGQRLIGGILAGDRRLGAAHVQGVGDDRAVNALAEVDQPDRRVGARDARLGRRRVRGRRRRRRRRGDRRLAGGHDSGQDQQRRPPRPGACHLHGSAPCRQRRRPATRQTCHRTPFPGNPPTGPCAA